MCVCVYLLDCGGGSDGCINVVVVCYKIITIELTSCTALASNRLWLENLKPKELLSDGPSSTWRQGKQRERVIRSF